MHRLKTIARSVSALVLAIAAIPAVNIAGGWISDHAFGLPPGGDVRLAADLSWVFMAGFVGTWLMVKTAAVAKTGHAWALFALYAALDARAVAATWGDYPYWFSLGVLLLLPLQVWLGWWLAMRKWPRGSRNPP